MWFSVCVSVVSCRKIAHTLASSCDLFPIDSLIRLSVFVHAHMHICVGVNIWTNLCLCIFMCIRISEALCCWQNTLSDLEPECNECNSEARTVSYYKAVCVHVSFPQQDIPGDIVKANTEYSSLNQACTL